MIIVHKPPTWYEGVVAIVQYADGKAKEVRVYPLMISSDAPHRGWPQVATGPDAQRILGAVRDRSKAFGTTLRIAGGIGIINVF